MTDPWFEEGTTAQIQRAMGRTEKNNIKGSLQLIPIRIDASTGATMLTKLFPEVRRPWAVASRDPSYISPSNAVIIGVAQANPIPWKIRKVMVRLKFVNIPIAAPDTAKRISPKTSKGFLPILSAMTPINKTNTTVGVLYEVINNPISIAETLYKIVKSTNRGLMTILPSINNPLANVRA